MMVSVLLQVDSVEQTGLTLAGSIIMVASIGFVLALVGFCVSRILREERSTEHRHEPLDIDTHDTES